RLITLKRPKLKYLIFLPYLFHIVLLLVFHDPEKVLNLLEVESGEGFASLILEPLSYILKWLALGFSLLLSFENTLFSLINLIYVVLAVYFIVRGRAQIVNEKLRAQSTIIIIGMSTAISLYTGTFIIPALFSIEISGLYRDGILIVALLIGGGSIIWSILSRRFLDIKVMIRQSLVYTVSSAILVGLYILLISKTDTFISSYFGGETTIINIAFIVIALILFQPINIQLDNLIRKLFIRTKTDHRNIINQLSRGLISVFDPIQLREMIEKTLKSTLMVEKVFFILFDDRLNEYKIIPSDDYPSRFIINRDDLFLGGVNQLDVPTLFDKMSLYRDDSKLASELEKRRTQLILPLKDADHMLGFLGLTGKSSGFKYNSEDISTLGIISNQLITALTNARLYADSLEKQRLAEEVTIARQIQVDLLPECPPMGDNFSICTFSEPSRIIGGDFYDFIEIEQNRFGMVIADVAGKGLPAALLVAQIQAALRSEARNCREISKILYNLNNHVARSTSSEKYATLFYSEFDTQTCSFNYSNAGHNYPIVVRADGSYESLSQGGAIIGAFSEMEFEYSSVKLEKDDLILFYTDGLSEAMDEDDNEYGEQRIIDNVIKRKHLSASEILNELLADIRQFDSSRPPRDDTTAIVLKVTC
ncbi:MAG: SpoIIE family protein phosphatase, partial [candidate division Zixibacteria bacterium]|nr:SpoIIE family protein phosphatase [candidate division Zixibacteria bacterium]